MEAFCDDVHVLIDKEKDLKLLGEIVEDFEKVSVATHGVAKWKQMLPVRLANNNLDQLGVEGICFPPWLY